MSLPTFFLTYEEYAKFSLASFKKVIESTPAKVLSEVTLGELCSMSEHPNGLYFIFGGNSRELQYVGKCTSRSFIERIPAHLDQREWAWFNTLPKKIMRNGHGYSSAHQEALSFEIVLFGIQDTGTASHLEKVFSHSYTPVLNTPGRIKVFDANATLDAIVKKKQPPAQEIVQA
jgi:hypothetical protein